MNSGVLLLYLKEIKKSGLFKICRYMCTHKEMFMPDQSAINKLVEHKVLCQRKYNEQRKLQSDTVFQHFTTSFRFFPIFHTVSVKPWQMERVHDVLKIHEYDALFETYQKDMAQLSVN
jgi:lipopolysaccharide biosynthesis glycosyltransferase